MLIGQKPSQASKKVGSHIAHQNILHGAENACTLFSNLVQAAPGRAQPGITIADTYCERTDRERLFAYCTLTGEGSGQHSSCVPHHSIMALQCFITASLANVTNDHLSKFNTCKKLWALYYLTYVSSTSIVFILPWLFSSITEEDVILHHQGLLSKIPMHFYMCIIQDTETFILSSVIFLQSKWCIFFYFALFTF